LSGAVATLSKHPFRILASILFCLLLLSIACDRALGNENPDASPPSPMQQGDTTSITEAGVAAAVAPQGDAGDRSIFTRLFDADENGDRRKETWHDNVSTLAFRLTLAALLGALLAFRPGRSSVRRQRDPYVVQTQILLTVVACALMMIVGDSAARAFGIFAAASLVRFRTNIRDPKETTVLLITLGVGLAAGVGRWELAAMFALFVLMLLQILETYERHQVVGLLELRVRTHDVEATDEAVRELFKRNNLDIDVRELNKESEKRGLGKVVYSVDMSAKFDKERLAEQVFMADPTNIDRIEFHRRKGIPAPSRS
jgi:uncharacterized membrane protein YhiD involved in acid resistance